MYIIKNNNTKLYLQNIIDEKAHLFHFVHEKDQALIFESKRTIPYSFRNHRWELIKLNDLKLFPSQSVSTYKIAKGTGISYSSLRDYCLGTRDKNNMTKATITKIANYLQISRGELLDLMEK